MKTEDRRVCPSCGNEFSGAVEFCPICMLRRVLDEEVESFSEQAQAGQGLVWEWNGLSIINLSKAEMVELGRGAMGSPIKRSTSIFDAP